MSRTPEDEDKKVELEHIELAHGKDEAAPHHLSDTQEHIAAHGKADEAANFLQNAGHIEYTAEDDARIVRRIDIYVMIPMIIIYMCQQLVRMRHNASKGRLK